jgi:hypothetical protein
VHNRTDASGPIWDDRRHHGAGCLPGQDHMLFIVGVVIVLVAVVVIRRMRVPGGVNVARLGWMSQQWLVEHRASHAP